MPSPPTPLPRGEGRSGKRKVVLKGVYTMGQYKIEKEFEKPTSLQKQAFFTAVMSYVIGIQIEKLNQAHLAAMEKLEKITAFLERLEKEERAQAHNVQDVVKVKIPQELLQENSRLIRELERIKNEIDSLQEKHKELDQERIKILEKASATQDTHRVAMIDAIGHVIKILLAPPPPGLDPKQIKEREEAAAFIKKYNVENTVEKMKTTPPKLSYEQTLKMVYESFKTIGVVVPPDVFLDSPHGGGIKAEMESYIKIRENNPELTPKELSVYSYVMKKLEHLSKLEKEQGQENEEFIKKYKDILNKMTSVIKDVGNLQTRYDEMKSKVDENSQNTETIRQYTTPSPTPSGRAPKEPPPESTPPRHM